MAAMGSVRCSWVVRSVAAVPLLLAPALARAQVSGTVVDKATLAPIEGAEVGVRADLAKTTTDAAGAFTLPNAAGADLVIAAGKKGYFNASVLVSSPASGVQIALPAVPQDDNDAYTFVTPSACSLCHPWQYATWASSPMAKAGLNTWVYDTYDGTGTPGGMGGFVYTRDSVHAGASPTSDCGACHQPEPWVESPFSGLGDRASPTPGMLHGISCEICHKLADIDETKVNFPGIYPGVVTLTRPNPGVVVEYGVLSDVDFVSPSIMRASFQPQLEAAACAACHQDKNDPDEDGDFEEDDGVISEPTYLEWLASPYADPASPLHETCAECHMPAFTNTTRVCEAVFPPIVRDPETIRSHTLKGTTPEYLENAVTVTMTAGIDGSAIAAEVTVVNDRTGHHVPTGVTVRNVILIVDAWREQDGLSLEALGKQRIHDLGGVGDPSKGYWAGLPGKLYAKHNLDADGNGPVFFSEATSILFDNRIAALASDVTSYAFALPQGGGRLHVRARLVYRRAFRALVDAKGWTQTGHGEVLEDLVAPDFGHLMGSAESIFDLPCDAGVCTADAGAGGTGGGVAGAGGAGGAVGSGGASSQPASISGCDCEAGASRRGGRAWAAGAALLALAAARRRARRA